ncbi:MAG: nucleotide sugar dehydrogenase [Prolixibacteraceae bacterium]|nr:nucleotide sugar dehydrogenase [Prolixibacteraceae bacterium]
MNYKEDILQKAAQKKVYVGIIGIGYVGLPLAVAFAREGLRVVGFDNSSERISQVNSGRNYIFDIDDDAFSEAVKSKSLCATNNFEELKKCDAIIICVPTPLDRFKKPDTSYIENACREIARNMKPGTFISLESTTYPTTTEEIILPILENESGLKHGEDFWLAFSPERVDPGNKLYNTKNTPKILGALTAEGLEIGKSIYGLAIESIHPVSSPRVAEMVKILENTYRLVNISLINELALLCGKMDIDIWEVIDAAATKPFGFQPFFPGPGIGGHCIPLDPFYLEHIAKKYNFDLSMIHTAGHIDMMMPHRMTIKINSALNRIKKSVNGSKILFLGVAYKPNIDDARESPALKIIDEITAKGGKVTYHDPFIPEITCPNGIKFCSVELDEKILIDSDCVVVTTNHDVFDANYILENSNLIVDLRNMFKEKSAKVYKL